jgi:hypothetical protein
MLKPLTDETPKTSRADHWVTLALSLFVFVTAAIPRLTDLGVFVGPDESSWVTRAANFFWALMRGDFAATYQTGHPGVFQMWVNTIAALLRYLFLSVTGGHPDLMALVGPDNTLSLLAAKRWDLAFVNALMIVGMFLLSRRAFGTSIALLGSLMVALDPFYLSEVRQVRTEASAASLMFLTLLALMVYLKEDKRLYLLVAGVLGGLAFLARITSVFLILFFGLLLGLKFVLEWWSNRRLAWRSTLYAACILGAALIVVVVALWPALWVKPVETLSEMSSYAGIRADEGKEGSGVFFMGRVYPDDPGSLFYPVAMLFRSTPLLWIGVVSGGVKLLLDLVRKRWSLSDLRSPRSYLNWSVVIFFLYSFLYMAMVNLGALKFDRYIVPALLPLDFGAAIGLFWFIKEVSRLTLMFMPRAFLSWTALLGIGVVIVIAAQGVWVWLNHPYYYTYYNPLLGGIQRAQYMLRVGYGEGVDQLAAYLNAKPNADRIKLASAMSSRFGPLFAGETIAMGNLDGHWIQADYVFLYISQIQRDKHDPEILTYLARQEPEFVLRLHGIEYGKLYPGPAAQYYSGTKLEGRGTLYGYDLSAAQLRAGDVLTATLYWRNEGQGPADSFFVSVADAADYPWSTALAQPRPGFDEAARNRKEIVESEAVLHIPIGMPPGHYFLKMGFVTDDGQTLVGRFKLPPEGDDVRVTLPDSFSGVDGVSVPHTLDFATEDVSLLGYDLSPATIQAGDRGWLTLFWRAKQDAPRDYVVGIRMLAAGGQEVTYWLGRPVYSGYAMSEWSRGQVVQDPWELSLPAEVPSGDYLLELVLFDSATGEPLAHTPLATWSVAAP